MSDHKPHPSSLTQHRFMADPSWDDPRGARCALCSIPKAHAYIAAGGLCRRADDDQHVWDDPAAWGQTTAPPGASDWASTHMYVHDEITLDVDYAELEHRAAAALEQAIAARFGLAGFDEGEDDMRDFNSDWVDGAAERAAAAGPPPTHAGYEWDETSDGVRYARSVYSDGTCSTWWPAESLLADILAASPRAVQRPGAAPVLVMYGARTVRPVAHIPPTRTTVVTIPGRVREVTTQAHIVAAPAVTAPPARTGECPCGGSWGVCKWHGGPEDGR